MDKLAKALQKQTAGKTGKGGVLDKIEKMGFTKMSEEKSEGATAFNERNMGESDRRNAKFAKEEQAKGPGERTQEEATKKEQTNGPGEETEEEVKKKKDFADKLNKSKWWE